MSVGPMKPLIYRMICSLIFGCVSKPAVKAIPENVTNKFCAVDIKEFEKLKKNMSKQEVYALVGFPTRHCGSGIAYDVYEFKKDTSVWIAWLKNKTAWAFIRSSSNPKKIIFE